jgi:hypothetical protein
MSFPCSIAEKAGFCYELSGEGWKGIKGRKGLKGFPFHPSVPLYEFQTYATIDYLFSTFL